MPSLTVKDLRALKGVRFAVGLPCQCRSSVTQRVAVLTISLGSGNACDATYLFSADLLGENRGHIPRHAKVYRDFAAEHDRLQEERVNAYREFISDVGSKAFPQPEHDVSMAGEEWEQFISSL